MSTKRDLFKEPKLPDYDSERCFVNRILGRPTQRFLPHSRSPARLVATRPPSASPRPYCRTYRTEFPEAIVLANGVPGAARGADSRQCAACRQGAAALRLAAGSANSTSLGGLVGRPGGAWTGGDRALTEE